MGCMNMTQRYAYTFVNLLHQDEPTMTDLKVLIQQYEERLRRKDAQHEAELEKKQRLEWRKHQQKVRLS